jgi:anti-sigma-K factor RskA
VTSDLHHLAAAYALDALDPDERQAFESHYPTCELCARDVLEFRETAAVLAGGVATAPPPELRSRVMDQIGRTRQLSPLPSATVVDLASRRRRIRPFLLGAAAAAALFVIGGVLGLMLASSDTDDVEDVLAAPDAVLTQLDGESGGMQVVWSPGRQQVALFASEMADPPPEQTYQLWFLLPDGVVSAGTFEPGDDGTVRTLLDVGDVEGEGWGVTIEPDGGLDQPTGELVLASTV